MGQWQEDLVTCAVRQYVLNESASPQSETLQMKYRVTRSVEVIYLEASKRIRLQPLYKSTVHISTIQLSLPPTQASGPDQTEQTVEIHRELA